MRCTFYTEFPITFFDGDDLRKIEHRAFGKFRLEIGFTGGVQIEFQRNNGISVDRYVVDRDEKGQRIGCVNRDAALGLQRLME